MVSRIRRRRRIVLAALVALIASAPVARADWKSFLHGEPPAPPKAAPPSSLARVTTIAALAPDPQVESFLRALAEGIKARDGHALLTRLSDAYAIDGLPDGARAPAVFAQAVEQIAGPTDMIVVAIEQDRAVRKARVEVRYAAEPPKTKTFAFDAAGKLLWTDLFAIRVGPA